MTEPQQLPAPDLSDAALDAVTAHLAAHAPTHDRDGSVPHASLRIAHEAGLLTATVGSQFGGPDVTFPQLYRLLVALGEGDASVALLVANTLQAHSAQAATSHWPTAYYDDVLRRSASEPTLVNALRAEPELGAPARGGLPATVARRTPEGWSLSGRKAYATGATALAYHIVWVVAEEPDADPAHPRVGHVIVPADLSGIEWIPTWDHLGLRASNTHDVVYTDVPLPPDAFVEVPRGPDGVYRDPAATTGLRGLAHSAIYVGVARAARTAFTEYAHKRVPSGLGHAIAHTERIQSVAGEIDAQIAQAETLLYGSALRVDAGEHDVLAQLSVIKALIARSAIEAVSVAVAALGNPGLSRHEPFERLLRDVLCARVHPPQEDAALRGAGRRVLRV